MSKILNRDNSIDDRNRHEPPVKPAPKPEQAKPAQGPKAPRPESEKTPRAEIQAPKPTSEPKGPIQKAKEAAASKQPKHAEPLVQGRRNHGSLLSGLKRSPLLVTLIVGLSAATLVDTEWRHELKQEFDAFFPESRYGDSHQVDALMAPPKIRGEKSTTGLQRLETPDHRLETKVEAKQEVVVVAEVASASPIIPTIEGKEDEQIAPLSKPLVTATLHPKPRAPEYSVWKPAAPEWKELGDLPEHADIEQEHSPLEAAQEALQTMQEALDYADYVTTLEGFKPEKVVKQMLLTEVKEERVEVENLLRLSKAEIAALKYFLPAVPILPDRKDR